MGNFFILEANAPKMFTDNLAKVHNIHRVELPSKLLLCQCHCSVLTCECVWSTSISLLCCSILTRVGTAARNVFSFICLMLFSHQAVPPSRSSCTPPRNPPTVALSPLSTPAPCWTETWGESLVLSSLEEGLLFYYLYAFVIAVTETACENLLQ